MSELWRALVCGVLYWMVLVWLPFPVDPCLFVVLLISVATRHEWAGLSLVLLMGICAESVLLVRPGIFLVAYLVAFTAIRAMAHRVRCETFWMRLWVGSCGAVLATVVLQQMYVTQDVPWHVLVTMPDVIGLAVTTMTATAFVPVLHAWCDGQWRRRRGLVGFA